MSLSPRSLRSPWDASPQLWFLALNPGRPTLCPGFWRCLLRLPFKAWSLNPASWPCSLRRNPHADLQAMDRCHRIGQQRPVLILRLATGNSIEVGAGRG